MMERDVANIARSGRPCHTQVPIYHFHVAFIWYYQTVNITSGGFRFMCFKYRCVELAQSEQWTATGWMTGCGFPAGTEVFFFFAMIPDWLWIPPRFVFNEIFCVPFFWVKQRAVMLYSYYHLMSTWRTIGATDIFTHTPYCRIIKHEDIITPTFLLVLLI